MPGRTAMVWHNRATARSLQGDVPGALGAFDEADLRYRTAGMTTGLLSVERAEALLSAGLVGEARAAATAAVAEFRSRATGSTSCRRGSSWPRRCCSTPIPGPRGSRAAAARRAAATQDRPGWAALAAFAELRALEVDGARPGALADRGRRLAVDLAAAGWLPQSLDATLLVARAALRAGRVDEARTALDASAGRDAAARPPFGCGRGTPRRCTAGLPATCAAPGLPSSPACGWSTTSGPAWAARRPPGPRRAGGAASGRARRAPRPRVG